MVDVSNSDNQHQALHRLIEAVYRASMRDEGLQLAGREHLDVEAFVAGDEEVRAALEVALEVLASELRRLLEADAREYVARDYCWPIERANALPVLIIPDSSERPSPSECGADGLEMIRVGANWSYPG